MKKLIALICVLLFALSLVTVAGADGCGHGETKIWDCRSYHQTSQTEHAYLQTYYCHCTLCGQVLWTHDAVVFREAHQPDHNGNRIRGSLLFEYDFCKYCTHPRMLKVPERTLLVACR